MTSTSPQKPLVILVGWMGCTPRYLRHYKALYEGLQCTVLPVIPSPVQCHFRSRMMHLVKDVARELRNHEVPRPRNAVIHVMSNNGGCFLSTFYQHICSLDSQNELRQWFEAHVKGILLENCPGVDHENPETVETLLRSMYISTEAYSFFNPMRYVFSMYNSIIAVTYRLITKTSFFASFADLSAPYYSYLRRLIDGNQNAEVDFILSTGDILVPPACIEEFISTCSREQKQMRLHYFDAPHVASFKSEKQEYERVIQDFLSRSLDQEEEK